MAAPYFGYGCCWWFGCKNPSSYKSFRTRSVVGWCLDSRYVHVCAFWKFVVVFLTFFPVQDPSCSTTVIRIQPLSKVCCVLVLIIELLSSWTTTTACMYYCVVKDLQILNWIVERASWKVLMIHMQTILLHNKTAITMGATEDDVLSLKEPAAYIRESPVNFCMEASSSSPSSPPRGDWDQ